MFRTIVVGFDGSPRGEDALELAGLLGRLSGARIVAASVYSPPALSSEDDVLARVLREEAEEIAAQAVRLCPQPIAEAVAVEEVLPARGLQQLARERDADLIVVGSSHRGRRGRITAGSVPEQLLHDGECAVAIAPAGYVTGEETRLATIGVGFDGGGGSRAALEVAVTLARAAGARLSVIGVIGTRLGALVPGTRAVPHAAYLRDIEQRERLAVDEAAAGLEGIEATAEPRLGEPVAATLTARSRELDLLVLGCHGYGLLRRLFHGSVSTALARAAACPLIVMPPVGRDVPAAQVTGAVPASVTRRPQPVTPAV